MKKTLLLSIVATTIIVGGGAFYGGMKYGESRRQNPALRNFGRQESGGQFRQGLPRQGDRPRNAGNGFTTGEIIAKDDKSITVKLPNGGSKIIFLSSSTEINKPIRGAPNDLEIGKNVTINGSANPDGSVTAETIQLRPLVNSPQP